LCRAAAPAACATLSAATRRRELCKEFIETPVDAGADAPSRRRFRTPKPTPAPTPRPTPVPPTAPPTPKPTPAPGCETCNNFGAPGTSNWCTCCKNDCFGSRANCIAQNNFCNAMAAVPRCLNFPGVCGAPTPAPTPAPTLRAAAQSACATATRPALARAARQATGASAARSKCKNSDEICTSTTVATPGLFCVPMHRPLHQ
jgi:hypothetical protein